MPYTGVEVAEDGFRTRIYGVAGGGREVGEILRGAIREAGGWRMCGVAGWRRGGEVGLADGEQVGLEGEDVEILLEGS